MLLGYKNLYLLRSFTNISSHLHSFANLFFCLYDMSVFPKIPALLAPSLFALSKSRYFSILVSAVSRAAATCSANLRLYFDFFTSSC